MSTEPDDPEPRSAFDSELARQSMAAGLDHHYGLDSLVDGPIHTLIDSAVFKLIDHPGALIGLQDYLLHTRGLLAGHPTDEVRDLILTELEKNLKELPWASRPKVSTEPRVKPGMPLPQVPQKPELPSLEVLMARVLGLAAGATEVLDASKYFSKTGLEHVTLRNDVLARGPIVLGHDGRLWRFHDTGVYLPDGREEVIRRAKLLLGQRARRAHIDFLIYDLEASEVSITGSQPLDIINVKNGLLYWEQGKLTEHHSDVLSTYQLNARWVPEATCPTVDDWLRQVVTPDVVPLFWEIVGTAIYPTQPFHKAVLFYGPGRNGKGTALRLIAALIGDEHIANVPLQELAESRFAAARLFGKVANIAGDLDARMLQRTDMFKMATGGDMLHAEFKFRQQFSFYNHATMLYSANELPTTADHSDGYFSRWVIVPFDKLRLEPGQEDKSLEARMHQELDGVLVRAVDGLSRALKQGCYTIPDTVAQATEDYRYHADPIRRFIDECLDVTGQPSSYVPRADIYTIYKNWCDMNGHHHFATVKFWQHLKNADGRIDPGQGPNGYKAPNGQTRVVRGVRDVHLP